MLYYLVYVLIGLLGWAIFVWFTTSIVYSTWRSNARKEWRKNVKQEIKDYKDQH